MFDDIAQQFLVSIKNTSLLEYLAVFTGLVSVWFCKKENILVYPIGLINTTMYVFLSFKNHLIGEAFVNLYFTFMNIYGWALWTRKNEGDKPVLQISGSLFEDWINQMTLGISLFMVAYIALSYLKNQFYSGVIPWADALASATAFTAMWLQAKKKVENWIWWIATNITSIPLYFVKGLVFTSLYYVILLGLAIAGLSEWKRRLKRQI